MAALGLLLHLSSLARPVFLEHCAARMPRIVQLTSHTNAEGKAGMPGAATCGMHSSGCAAEQHGLGQVYCCCLLACTQAKVMELKHP